MIEQRKYDYFKVYITTKIASVVLFYTERKKKTQNTLGVKLWKININLPFFVVFFCHISNNIFTPSCTRLPCFKYPMIWTDCLTYRVPSFDHWVALRCTLCFYSYTKSDIISTCTLETYCYKLPLSFSL